MISHMPYDPPQAGYSTVPPWATEHPARPAPAPGHFAASGAVGRFTVAGSATGTDVLPPPGPPPWGDVPYSPKGRVLVTYPARLDNAVRPGPPAWIPVVLWMVVLGVVGAVVLGVLDTVVAGIGGGLGDVGAGLLVGVGGAIAAGRRAGRARRLRKPRDPYWIAFGVTFVAGVIAWTVPGGLAASL